MPPNPSMHSFITVIVDKKTSHLRELVVNQKTKKPRPKRYISSPRGGSNRSANFNSRDYYNNNNHRNEYSTPKNDNSARGYNHIKFKSSSPKPCGTVTTELREYIENLLNTSEVSFMVLFTTIIVIIFIIKHFIIGF